MRLPGHRCGLYLSHNEHRDCYETVSEFIDSHQLSEDFASPAKMEESIASDEIWVIQWYPETPIGFLRVAAPTLEDALEMANSEVSP